MIVADTGAIVALVDADDAHHQRIRALYERDPQRWWLPWAILPEVDYLLLTRVGAAAERAFVSDIAEARYSLIWDAEADLSRAQELCEQYRDLALGLVDAVVIASAERLHADAIATLDLRHFGAVKIQGNPKLLPRDS